ncbi:tetratricopeptide repeat protein [bacterium]|nr:tetratricopeptide repeat protein [bacterium]
MAKIWDEKDNKFLKENYLKYSNKELADMFDVTKKSIQGKLRRLGLHRKDEVVAEDESTSEVILDDAGVDEPEKKPIFRRKRLSHNIPVVAAPLASTVPFRSVEMTEKRKRVIREFDNVMKVLSEGDKEEALREFQFIRENFPRELDIVQKVNMWISLLNREPDKKPESAEELYIVGVRLSQKNQLKDALEHFEKAFELDQEYLDAKYNIACIHCKNGEYQKSMQLLEELAEIDERFIESATQDEDFESIWENEEFIELALNYLDIEEEQI